MEGGSPQKKVFEMATEVPMGRRSQLCCDSGGQQERALALGIGSGFPGGRRDASVWWGKALPTSM